MNEKQTQIRSTDRKGPSGATSEDSLGSIGRADLEQFRTDGVVMVKNILHPEWLLLLELGLRRVMNNSSQEMHMFFQGEKGEFIETIRNFTILFIKNCSISHNHIL